MKVYKPSQEGEEIEFSPNDNNNSSKKTRNTSKRTTGNSGSSSSSTNEIAIARIATKGLKNGV